MAPAAHRPPPPTGGYIVPAPRVTDAIGGVLRGVYPEIALPADMTALLARICNA